MVNNLLQPVAPYPFPLSAEIENIHRNANLTGAANVTAITASTTLTALHAGLVTVDTSSAAVTLTLPSAAGSVGLTYIFKIVVSGNALTLDGAGSELIDGAATLVMTQLHRAVTIRCDGVGWNILSGLDNNPAGVIFPFGGTTAPTGYLLCDGSSKLRTDYPALFAAIGTAFGSADSTHFNIPDARGRFLRGVDHAQGRDPDRASRTAMATGGNTGDNVGSVQADGFKSHTHTQDAHSHYCVENSAAVTVYDSTSPGAGNDGRMPRAQGTLTAGKDLLTNSATATNQNTGGNETRPINIGVEYIIRY